MKVTAAERSRKRREIASDGDGNDEVFALQRLVRHHHASGEPVDLAPRLRPGAVLRLRSLQDTGAVETAGDPGAALSAGAAAPPARALIITPV